ncbi:hypothetical protein C8R45DRAFT_935947 [Mycena sanguinolenta]|nr:hypothetical protein C8R45DRAFT_935947 [Mycena sanguinolenta]
MSQAQISTKIFVGHSVTNGPYERFLPKKPLWAALRGLFIRKFSLSPTMLFSALSKVHNWVTSRKMNLFFQNISRDAEAPEFMRHLQDISSTTATGKEVSQNPQVRIKPRLAESPSSEGACDKMGDLSRVLHFLIALHSPVLATCYKGEISSLEGYMAAYKSDYIYTWMFSSTEHK